MKKSYIKATSQTILVFLVLIGLFSPIKVISNNFEKTNTTFLLAQKDRTGTMLVYFVVNKRARKTERVFTHILAPGEDTYTAKEILRKKHGVSLGEFESLSLSATSIKPGQCAVIYSGDFYDEYRYGFMKLFESKNDAIAWVKDQELHNSTEDFKLTKILDNPDNSKQSFSLSDKETIEIYDFIFGKGSGSRLGEISKNDKKVAGAILKQLVDGSCKMGYLESLTTSTLNPSATTTTVIRKLITHHLKTDCPTNLKNGKIYNSVFVRIKSVWRTKFRNRVSLKNWK